MNLKLAYDQLTMLFARHRRPQHMMVDVGSVQIVVSRAEWLARDPKAREALIADRVAIQLESRND